MTPREPGHGTGSGGTAASAAAPGRRRGRHRRATGGTAPDTERALGPSGWGDPAQRLGADAPDPRDAEGGAGHEQWLREQRPPHWG
ncbi:hypothetical protein C1C97_004550 [Kocuria tytonis]|uniref:Uncharacterized protein n=1 Tax=Kocuria tytonis TaxID=2054280 RepID=A0A495AE29_9MICC|nr:hypothetical protein C1C97_004550 [Kocuria tytonis]